MAKYLGLKQADDVSIVNDFPANRIFNLVGTDSRDYLVLGGLSAWAAGETSDGLVRIENATTHGSERAKISNRHGLLFIAVILAISASLTQKRAIKT